MRFIPPDRPDTKGGHGARKCEADGCNQATRENKPFCSDHVDQHPYVQAILATLAGDEEEIERIQARGKKAVDTDGSLVASILLQLEQNGERTLERLSRDLWVDKPIVETAVRELAKQGIVTLGMTKRKSTTAMLASKPPQNGEHPD